MTGRSPPIRRPIPPTPRRPLSRASIVPAAPKIKAEARSPEARCPFCHDGAFDSVPSIRCLGCDTWQHAACVREHSGRCSAPGCNAQISPGTLMSDAPERSWSAAMILVFTDMASNEADLARLNTLGIALLVVFNACVCLYLLAWPWWTWLVVFLSAGTLNVLGRAWRWKVRARTRSRMERE